MTQEEQPKTCLICVHSKVHVLPLKSANFMVLCLKLPLGPYILYGERGGSVVECRTPEREVGGSKPTAAVLCP